MTHRFVRVVAVIAATTGTACLAQAAEPARKPAAVSVTAAAPTVSAEELGALKAQLQALQERLAQLEAAQVEQRSAQETVNTELQESVDRGSDNLARAVGESASSGWLARWQWKGDLRVRNETIQQEFNAVDRNRNRYRLRAGAMARVKETTRVEIQFASGEGADARSSNQTMTDANSRKALDLDLAYVEWVPTDTLRFTAGKMKYPWVRVQSYFFDNDVNPEGVAAAWQQGATGFFGSVFYTSLAERSNFADSSMVGAQLGWRAAASDGSRTLLAMSYYDHAAVKGYNPFQNAGAGATGLGAFGNTTTTNTAVCRRAVYSSAGAVSPCLANAYDIVELLGEYQFNLGPQPLLLFGNVARNLKADFGVVSTTPSSNVPAGLDTAYSVGFNYGRANASL
ncbi:MAG: putative porin, partial [Gammaproteobacteria bacterium]